MLDIIGLQDKTDKHSPLRDCFGHVIRAPRNIKAGEIFVMCAYVSTIPELFDSSPCGVVIQCPYLREDGCHDTRAC